MTLATGSNDVKICNLNNGSLIKSLQTKSFVWSLSVLNDEYIACGLESSDTQIWNSVNGSLIHTLNGHAGQINVLTKVKTKSNEILASASDDSTIKLWNLQTNKLVRTKYGNSSEVNVLVTYEGYLISGYSSPMIWELDNGTLIKKLVGHGSGVFAFSFLTIY